MFKFLCCKKAMTKDEEEELIFKTKVMGQGSDRENRLAEEIMERRAREDMNMKKAGR